MIHFLSDEEIAEIVETDKAEEEKYGVLYPDGESADCLYLKEAIEMVDKYGGEIYTYE